MLLSLTMTVLSQGDTLIKIKKSVFDEIKIDLIKGDECAEQRWELLAQVKNMSRVAFMQDSTIDRLTQALQKSEQVVKNKDTELSIAKIGDAVDAKSILDLGVKNNVLTTVNNKQSKQIKGLKLFNKIELLGLLAAALKIFILK